MITRAFVALMALAAICTAVWQIERTKSGLLIEDLLLGPTPMTIYRQDNGPPGPAVVIAHGFAGSRQLMEPFAVTLAQAGFVAVSFDFLGHGANRAPLTGDVTKEEGATRALQGELARVISWARQIDGTDGRVAVLGHSMASDIIVREAVADPEIAATVVVSMFSRQVTRDAPANLLMIVGEWEGFLASEAQRILKMTEPSATFGVTYGNHGDGTARRAILANNVEHVGVLYSSDSLREATRWLQASFGREGNFTMDARGPWILLLITGVVALGWPLAALLPRVPVARSRQRPPIRQLLTITALPAIATPLVLWPMPTDFLPVLVADYLVLHFALYGCLTMLMLARTGCLNFAAPGVRLLLGTTAATLYGIFAIGLALETYVASFLPHAGRAGLIAALACGALIYSLADEWLIRLPGVPWWLGLLSKLFFLLSLAAAVALDLENLFFLAIITPVILLFFVIYGLFARWVFGATEHPSVAGIANGLAFGWALGVTFPLLAS